MASAWIIKRPTKDGKPRYRVLYRLGGREASNRYAGTFERKDDAQKRRNWIIGELAAMRVPDLSILTEPEPVPTFAEMAKRWQASRVDVRESTVIQHRTALGRCALIDRLPIDKITPVEIAGLVGALADEGKARDTIRKTVTAIAMVMDFGGINPNPARDRTKVRLPRSESAEIEPPDATTVEAVARRLTSPHLIGLAVLDVSGWRVSAVGQARIEDLDEENARWLVRAAVNKTKTSCWGYLSDDMVPDKALLNAVLSAIPRREDRDSAAFLFPEVGVDGARLRTAIARACRDAGVPPFSPHDLRHRRISLLHRQGIDWARIGRRVGQRNLATTANRYTHAMIDPREVDWAELLVQAL